MIISIILEVPLCQTQKSHHTGIMDHGPDPGRGQKKVGRNVDAMDLVHRQAIVGAAKNVAEVGLVPLVGIGRLIIVIEGITGIETGTVIGTDIETDDEDNAVLEQVPPAIKLFPKLTIYFT